MTTWFLQAGALLDLHLLLTCCVALIYINKLVHFKHQRNISWARPRIRKYMDDNTDVRFGWARALLDIHLLLTCCATWRCPVSISRKQEREPVSAGGG